MCSSDLDARHGSVKIHQDADVYAALLEEDDRVVHSLASGRRAFLHIARGSVNVNGHVLATGDALKVTQETQIAIEGVNVSITGKSSATVVCNSTGMPTAASSMLSHWLFVSSLAPVVSSVPIAMISACI